MTTDPQKLDCLVIAAHPDDAEIAVGGTLLKLVAAGKRVGIVDLTRGELGTRGSASDRTAESTAADAIIGTQVRINLGLPDGRVEVNVKNRELLSRALRELRPELVLAHHADDLHPDHAAAGELARQAWYLAGLRKLAQQDGGPPALVRPRLYHFMGHVPFEATLVVDVESVWKRKVELIQCYASQLTPETSKDSGAHFLFGADVLARAETKARYWGERIGRRYGEPLLHLGPLPAFDPLLGAH